MWIQVIINDDFWSFVLRMCCARTVTHTDTHYVAEVLGKWYFFKGCTLCVYVSSNKKNEHKSLSTFFQRRKTRGRGSIGERHMRNIRAYTNTHTHIYVEICNTWVALKRDQIKDCLLFYEWLKDSKQPLNACHTVCLLQECCAGLTHQLEAGVHHQLTTRFKSHPFKPRVGLWVGGFGLHIGDPQEQTRDFYSVASSSFFLYKYILIYVKRFIFFVSVICVSVTIKCIHLV